MLEIVGNKKTPPVLSATFQIVEPNIRGNLKLVKKRRNGRAFVACSPDTPGLRKMLVDIGDFICRPDVVAIAEGKRACYLHLLLTSHPNGARRIHKRKAYDMAPPYAINIAHMMLWRWVALTRYIALRRFQSIWIDKRKGFQDAITCSIGFLPSGNVKRERLTDEDVEAVYKAQE